MKNFGDRSAVSLDSSMKCFTIEGNSQARSFARQHRSNIAA
jgi:hypothetical protein